jgi:ribosomal protein S18 acetylase RimI-like enzyme
VSPADDALDNPIWSALTTEQTRFARRERDAAAFPPEVTQLAGLRTPDAIGDLAALLTPGERTGLFLAAPIGQSTLRIVEEDELLQMTHDGALPDEVEGDPIALSRIDHADMRALADLTRPGPFGARTTELGVFYGLRSPDKQLMGMAGQRLRVPGHIEISAICTHPSFGGRGLARRLTGTAIARVLAEGALPFLHVRASNTRAVALYERIGFRPRRSFRYTVVEK